ncbi:polymerase, partial [Vibrio vulnificus]
MWKLCLSWNEKKTEITAKLPEADLGSELVRKELDAVIAEMEGAELYLDDAEVVRFLNCARECKAEAYDGIVIAKRLNAQLDI